jgi:hypothetical protein
MFFILLKSSWNIDIQNYITFLIWSYNLKVMLEKKNWEFNFLSPLLPLGIISPKEKGI